ncbi:hypothetical protein CLV24_14711 [Pontibacter ummariensis]|uniref:Uncharacterized protein n=1 Tax=Pontibacter ummariensis TaxID=1610492 RepID=A0A239LMU0_9BACT|nr:hypothetical protein CLV24_14711 [Pontibacter ummariensis]SNT30914.1 hypothetical protein SAMN06296052_1444 [Pontibacter ummariensis]
MDHHREPRPFHEKSLIMLLYKKDTGKHQEQAANRIQDRAAFLVARAIYQQQERVAKLLSCKFSTLPLYTRKGCLLLFCLLLGGAHLSVFMHAVWPKQPIRKVSLLELFLPKRYTETSSKTPASRGIHQDNHAQQQWESLDSQKRPAQELYPPFK